MFFILTLCQQHLRVVLLGTFREINGSKSQPVYMGSTPLASPLPLGHGTLLSLSAVPHDKEDDGDAEVAATTTARVAK